MRPNVLIVDDDQAFLRLIQKDLEGFSESFNVLTAESGNSALDLLTKTYVSFVVSDLRMPGMDGFELLSSILKKFPDIPVYMMTSYDKPKTKDVVIKSGAVGYLRKPFTAIELFGEITKTLNKKAEGGSLHNVTLETFLQLIEMEQQTSTLRIVDKKGGRGGVLFFRNGELMNARFGDKQGKDSAYEILSWSNVSLSIEHDCVFQEKIIQGDLQAILLDAMRMKDELAEAIEMEEEAGNGEILLDSPVPEAEPESAGAKPEPVVREIPTEKPKTIAKVRPAKKEAEISKLSPIDTIRMKINNSIGSRSGVLDIYHDQSWDGLIDQASNIGNAFNCGRLNVLYVNREKEEQFIILPGEETTAISISSDSPWDRIIDVLG
ncbi:MAG: response regulator [Desulfobacteraceae bacterium]|nr:response regulator [Desulfobacteraceae bacterium]MBC2756674.1 response regulator [Desulfobacteraceae bacterium]